MSDRFNELQNRAQRSRAALDALAERATALRTRVEAVVDRPAPPAMAQSALARSLDRLAQAENAHPPVLQATVGGDGEMVADAWEIALINEEGK